MKPCKREQCCRNMAHTLVWMPCKLCHTRGAACSLCDTCAHENKLCSHCGLPLKVRHKDDPTKNVSHD